MAGMTWMIRETKTIDEEIICGRTRHDNLIMQSVWRN